MQLVFDRHEARKITKPGEIEIVNVPVRQERQQEQTGPVNLSSVLGLACVSCASLLLVMGPVAGFHLPLPKCNSECCAGAQLIASTILQLTHLRPMQKFLLIQP
jgi:hypothetical protein